MLEHEQWIIWSKALDLEIHEEGYKQWYPLCEKWKLLQKPYSELTQEEQGRVVAEHALIRFYVAMVNLTFGYRGGIK